MFNSRKEWSEAERIHLNEMFALYGKNWQKIANTFKDRSVDSVRNRCVRDFFPERVTSTIMKTRRTQCDTRHHFKEDEDLQIIKFVVQHGRKWDDLQKKEIPQRSMHALRNRYARIISGNSEYFRRLCSTYNLIVANDAIKNKGVVEDTIKNKGVEDTIKNEVIAKDMVMKTNIYAEKVNKWYDFESECQVSLESIEMFDAFLTI